MNVNLQDKTRIGMSIKDLVKEALEKFYDEVALIRRNEGGVSVIDMRELEQLGNRISEKCGLEIMDIIENKLDISTEDIIKDFMNNRHDISDVVKVGDQGSYKLSVSDINSYVETVLTKQGSGEAHIILIYEK